MREIGRFPPPLLRIYMEAILLQPDSNFLRVTKSTPYARRATFIPKNGFRKRVKGSKHLLFGPWVDEVTLDCCHHIALASLALLRHNGFSFLGFEGRASRRGGFRVLFASTFSLGLDRYHCCRCSSSCLGL